MRNGRKGREKRPLASRRGRPGHSGGIAPIHPRCRTIVHRHPTGGGKELAILRPGVLRLAVNLASPFAPPPSGEPSRHCRPIVRRQLWGCEDGPERRRGAPEDPPSPAPTPISVFSPLSLKPGPIVKNRYLENWSSNFHQIFRVFGGSPGDLESVKILSLIHI